MSLIGDILAPGTASELRRLKCGHDMRILLFFTDFDIFSVGATGQNGNSVLDQQISVMLFFNKNGEPKRFRNYPAKSTLVGYG